MCENHEWYIDVACSYHERRAHGAETIRRLMAYAAKRGVRALRLYATPATLEIWRDRWGFREADTVLRANGQCVHGAHSRRSYPVDPGEERTYRMTRMLNDP